MPSIGCVVGFPFPYLFVMMIFIGLLQYYYYHHCSWGLCGFIS